MRAAIRADVAANVALQGHARRAHVAAARQREQLHGLSWASFEIEALPGANASYGAREVPVARCSADHRRTRRAGASRSIANSDLQLLDLIAEECKGPRRDGYERHRAASVGDMYQRVRDKLGIFARALLRLSSATRSSAHEPRGPGNLGALLIGQWREICRQAPATAASENAIGGMVFQWSDGWCYSQDSPPRRARRTRRGRTAASRRTQRGGEQHEQQRGGGINHEGSRRLRGLYNVPAPPTRCEGISSSKPYAADANRAGISAHFAPIDAVSAKSRPRQHPRRCAPRQERTADAREQHANADRDHQHGQLLPRLRPFASAPRDDLPLIPRLRQTARF